MGASGGQEPSGKKRRPTKSKSNWKFHGHEVWDFWVLLLDGACRGILHLQYSDRLRSRIAVIRTARRLDGSGGCPVNWRGFPKTC